MHTELTSPQATDLAHYFLRPNWCSAIQHGPNAPGKGRAQLIASSGTLGLPAPKDVVQDR
jgi:hypothetical protein